MQRCAERLANLTVPLGGLGQLEDVLIRLAGMSGRVIPAVQKPAMLIFAADHGVSAEGVSAYDREVTEQMAVNVCMGSAVSSVLARRLQVPLQLIDVGVASPVRHPYAIVRKVMAGTNNMAHGPAMSREQAKQAAAIGAEGAALQIRDGCDMILIGELGIGNTTVAAAMACAMLGLTPDEAVGAGAGVSEQGILNKRAIVSRILRVHGASTEDPWDLMAAMGGLEIAALAGAIGEAATAGVPVLLDGVTTTVAAVWAHRLNPDIRHVLVASHLSPEPAHSRLLDHLGLSPLISLGLRIGEGAGGLFALPLIQNACRVLAETATFADARVANPHQTGEGLANPDERPSNLGEGGMHEDVQEGMHEGTQEGMHEDGGSAAGKRPVASDFTVQERDAVYKTIAARRDMRVFLPDPLPEDVIARIFWAAHHAPSVGYMQPWNFIAVTDRAILQRLQEVVERERVRASDNYKELRQAYYLRLKIEGIAQAPLTVCVTNDSSRGGPHVLGRNTIPETDLMSTACAIENMWLAARAEGIGMGWVSFYRKEDVRRILSIPDEVDPIALLTFGFTPHFPDIPVLERIGWGQRLDLEELVFDNTWGTVRQTSGGSHG